MAIILWLIKQADHTHAVKPSLALLRYFRLLFIMCITGSLICTLASLNIFNSFLTSVPIELQYLTLLIIVGTGIMRYIYQIIQLHSIIKKAAYRRHINNICVLYTSDASACSFSLMKKSYIALPVALLEQHEGFILTMRHEMQHCRQYDGLWRHIISLVQIISWWNPMCQRVTHHANHISELCCDQAVVNKYALTAHAYSSTLLLAKKNMDSAYSAPTHSTISQLEKQVIYSRIQQLFKQPQNNIKRTQAWLRITLISCLVLTTSLLTLNATAHVLTMPSQLIHSAHTIMYLTNEKPRQ